jgi:hypothetical protein
MNGEVRKEPCSTCPYRKDVPSGVWSFDTYEILRPYDEPTFAQPFKPFGCHTTPDFYCHGWAVVHTSRGNEFDLVSLRMARLGYPDIPEPAVPLFASGNEAADHGQRDLDNPSAESRAAVDKLLRKYDRIREGNPDLAG